MRILMIVPYLPYPPTSGGEVRVYNLIKFLSKEHRVTLLCYLKLREKNKAQHVSHLLKYCEDVQIVARRPVWSIYNLVLTAFSKYPFRVVVNGFCREMECKILEVINHGKLDLVHVEHCYMAQPVMKIRQELKIPLLLDKQGIEFLVLFRYFQTIQNPLLKMLYYMDGYKLKKYEMKLSKNFDVCTVVSKDDSRALRHYITDIDLSIVPNGVDLAQFNGSSMNNRNKEPIIIFTGTFRFVGNVDAMVYFCQHIFPLISNRVSGVRLYIIGGNVPKRIKRLRSESVVVVGYVPHRTIREHVARSDVFVAPLRVGSGTKFKILEAMAMRKPVVSTSIGMEGIEAVPGKDAFIADTSEEFAEAVIRLLKDEKLRKRIGLNGRKLVEAKYDWDPICKKLSRVYQDTVEKFAFERKRRKG